jgi:hypothetical protein
MKPQLIGKWALFSKENNIKVTLEFRTNNEIVRTSELIENETGRQPEIVQDTYRLHGNLLILSSRPKAAVQIALKDNALTYTLDGLHFFTLTKMD